MKQLFLLLSILLISTISYAQVNISGKIVDKASQVPLAGVNVKLKYKLVGTVSNPNGEFNFTTKEKLPFEIEISMVGYQTQSINIESNNSNLAINMVEKIYFGEEIIVSASRVQENILQSSLLLKKWILERLMQPVHLIFMTPSPILKELI